MNKILVRNIYKTKSIQSHNCFYCSNQLENCDNNLIYYIKNELLYCQNNLNFVLTCKECKNNFNNIESFEEFTNTISKTSYKKQFNQYQILHKLLTASLSKRGNFKYNILRNDLELLLEYYEYIVKEYIALKNNVIITSLKQAQAYVQVTRNIQLLISKQENTFLKNKGNKKRTSPIENLASKKKVVYHRFIEEQEHKCIYCNQEIIDKYYQELAPTSEHLIPKSIIKSDIQMNLVIACYKCNSKRRNKSLHHFIKELLNDNQNPQTNVIFSVLDKMSNSNFLEERFRNKANLEAEKIKRVLKNH